MEELFQNKYRVPSTRLSGWDYSSFGFYFATICAHNHVCYFGDVLRDDNRELSVALSPIGKIARDYWLDIPKHFPFVILDEFIVMPNHVHGILQIDKSKSGGFVETQNFASLLYKCVKRNQFRNGRQIVLDRNRAIWRPLSVGSKSV